MAARAKIRIAFFVLVGFLWLGVVCVGLEVYTAHRLNRVEKTNKFVAQYNRDLIWADLDANFNLLPLPPVPQTGSYTNTITDQDDHLGALFSVLSEEDRATLANLRDLLILVYDRSGRNLGTYGSQNTAQSAGFDLSNFTGKSFSESPLASEAGASLALIQRVFDTGKPETAGFEVQRQNGPMTLEIACYPMKDASGKTVAVACTVRTLSTLTFTEEQARKADARTNAMWKMPWFEYRKNVRLGPRWSSNNVGFRDHYVALPKPPGLFRVACIGGSTTAEGYLNDTTYPKLIEKKIQADMPGRPIEVLNCGVFGLDSLLEKRRALDYARLEPDLVIEYNGVNDICHALLFTWTRDAKPWQKWLRQSRFLCRHFNFLFWPNEQAMAAQIDRTVMQNLKTINDVLKKHNSKTAICSFACPDPSLLSRDEWDYFDWNVRTYWQGQYATFDTYCRLVRLYNREVKKLCEKEGIPYVPLAEQFKADIDCFGDICHMRPKGIEKKADIIREWLEDYLKGEKG